MLVIVAVTRVLTSPVPEVALVVAVPCVAPVITAEELPFPLPLPDVEVPVLPLELGHDEEEEEKGAGASELEVVNAGTSVRHASAPTQRTRGRKSR